MSRPWCTVALSLAVALCVAFSRPVSLAPVAFNPDSHEIGSPGVDEPLGSAPTARSTIVALTNGPLTVQAPLADPDVVDAGLRLNLSVGITGGYPPYNITWLGLPYGCASENKTKFHCFPGAPSGLPTTSEISVQVIDAMGNNETSNASSVTVNPDPTIAIDITPESAGVPPFFVNFTAIPTGGTAPYDFNWTFGDGGYGNGTTVEHEYTTTGIYPVTVWGNDSLGETAIGHAKVHSVALPSVLIAIAPQTTVPEGADVTFSVTPVGGLGPFTYEWTGLPAFCSPPSQPNATAIACADSMAGIYTVTVLATDALEHSAIGTVTLTVTAPTPLWEYVALGFTSVAIILAVIVSVQLVRYRRERRRPPPSLTGPETSRP